MYNLPIFKVNDPETILKFMKEHPFIDNLEQKGDEGRYIAAEMKKRKTQLFSK